MEINQLTKLIKKKTGMRIQDFTLEKMGIKYTLYRYRVLNDCLKMQDYHSILFYTGKSFEDLFPNPLAGTPRKPITLNLRRPPATTTNAEVTPFAKPQVSQAKPQATKKKDAFAVPPEQEDTKKEGDLTPPRTFEFHDPFGGMMPD